MKTILEELFDGNIYPDELIISRDPEYYPLNKKISATMEMWKKKLSEDDFKQLEDLLDLRSQSDSMHASASQCMLRHRLCMALSLVQLS